jgi:hypothetical protein
MSFPDDKSPVPFAAMIRSSILMPRETQIAYFNFGV